LAQISQRIAFVEKHVKPTWILVACRSGATILSSLGPELTKLREIEHPRGRLKASDLETDRPGRAFDRGGQGRHAMSSEESPTEHLAQRFAAELARELEHARHMGAFNQLVLVAAPRLLGKLRAELSDATRKIVIGEVPKDLVEPSATELREHLAPILRV
jgi:protein required for attachment to host cells